MRLVPPARFRVVVDGIEYDVTASPATVVAFERHFDTSYVRLFAGGGRSEWFLWLAWHALGVDGVTRPLFDDWCKRVTDIELVTVEPEVTVDPLSGPSDDGSPP